MVRVEARVALDMVVSCSLDGDEHQHGRLDLALGVSHDHDFCGCAMASANVRVRHRGEFSEKRTKPDTTTAMCLMHCLPNDPTIICAAATPRQARTRDSQLALPTEPTESVAAVH